MKGIVANENNMNCVPNGYEQNTIRVLTAADFVRWHKLNKMIKKGDKIKVKDNLVSELLKLGFEESSAKSMRKFENTEQIAYDIHEYEGTSYATIEMCCEIPLQCCEMREEYLTRSAARYLYLVLAPVVRFLGLKGSWKWAVKEMKKGNMVVTASATGAVKYKLSTDSQDRLQWDFHRKESEAKWETANFFISDMMAIDWQVYNWC